MLAKCVLIFCIQAFFNQTALSQQCTTRAAIDASGYPYGRTGYSQPSPVSSGLAYNGWAGRRPCDGYSSGFTPTNGGGLPVTSVSAISPTGITVKSDNAYEGALNVVGELPFISAVGMEGRLATTGAGATQYGCGSVVAMLSDGPVGVGPVYSPYGPGFTPAFGAGSGFGAGTTLGLGGSFSPATSTGTPAGFATARLGYGCGRGLY